MVYDKSALKHMREAGLRLTEVIYKLREEVVAGITGEELDAIAEKLILSLNSIPSFKGYGPGIRVYISGRCRYSWHTFQETAAAWTIS